MTTYTISQIASILQLPQPAVPDHTIDRLLTDSRALTRPQGTLFIALQSATGDGHRYISQLYQQGVRNFLVSYIPPTLSHISDANFLVTPDTTVALQSIARFHRRQFPNTPVVAITGSRGKTTVKEWIYSLLNPDRRVLRSPRSYNSQIGVPLSVWELNDDTDIAIFEAGISQQGEMPRLQSILSPTIGIFTNITDQHNEGFQSPIDKCRQKATLFKDCDCIIYNADDPIIAPVIDSTPLVATTHIAWSRHNPSAPLYVKETSSTATHTTITYCYNNGTDHTLTLPLTTPHDIENSLHCLALMLHLNIDHDTIALRMSTLTPVATRLDVIDGINNCTILHDSYTCDLHSLAAALDFLRRRLSPLQTTTVILSDLTHETLSPSLLYQRAAQLLDEYNIDSLIAIGDEIARHASQFACLPSATFHPSTAQMLADTPAEDFADQAILIKCAPAHEPLRIVEALEARLHETVLEVNLDALTHNFNAFRSLLRPETGIVCMLKASGYGAGSYQLAKTLQSQGAAYIAVAVLDEGIELRRAGITMPIMVLNPKVVNYRAMFANRLEPEIYSFEMLDQIIRQGEKYGLNDYPVHIKLDTGMHRLGFLPDDMPRLAQTLHNQNIVKVETIFSHLATADCLDMDDYTLSQLNTFDKATTALQSHFPHHIRRHILNSAGISRFPQFQYDLVRLGIGLYGIPVLPSPLQDGLRPVSSLHTVIISIKEWDPGDTIGYSRRGQLTRHSRIATIPIGYADGLNRHLGRSASSVFAGGKRCPIIGNICMDACMIDITDTNCQVGDRVEIFGDNIPVTQLADILGTIPYEILTSVSTRVKRIYFRE